ncbi:hypothetical protein [Microbacterium hominis]|uniref:hypothetical protein n=1 Tax=Microbacterium hominis TaxID=162426 RepID=UPI0012FEFF18|nr:hypothetical protein [Microbacterium hominis]
MTWARVIGLPPTQRASDLITVSAEGAITIRAVGHDPDAWPDVDPTRSTAPPYRGGARS